MRKQTPLAIKRIFFLLAIVLSSTCLFSNSFENKNDSNLHVPTVKKVAADNPTFSPLTGHAGTIVTITDLAGTFTNIPLSTVTLNGAPISSSDITFISSTELTVIIPCGSTSGAFIVDGGLPSVLDFNYIAPSVDPLVDQTYCVSETAFPVALSGQPATPTDGVLEFLWSSSNASIGLTNAFPLVPDTEIPTFTPLNTTTEPISSIITVTPIINGCTGPSTNYTITVNPRPIANSIASIVVCAGELVPQIALSASSPFSGAGSSFTWSGDNNVAIGLGILSGSTSPIPQFTATNTTGSAITSTFTVTPTFDGCDGTPITFTIDVLPDNFAGTLTFDICSGDTFTQTLTSSIPGTIGWFRAAVSGILEGDNSGIDIINEVLTNTTDTTISVTYDLTLPSGPTCNDTQFIVVNVAPLPSDATIITGGPQLVCAGATGNVYNTAVIPNATSYVWTLPDGSNVTTPTNSISINYAVSDTSGNLTVHGENSCGIGGESTNYPITIIAQPTLLSSVTPPNICSEDIFNYTPVPSAFGASLSWTRAIQPGISNPPGIGNNDITESLINATNATLPVVYTYTITTAEGCVNTQDITVLVDPLPKLTSPLASTAVCSGTLFNIPLISDVAGTVSWSRVVFPGIAEASSSGSDFINETLTNTTNATISVPYTITLPTSTEGCDAPVITIFVDVEPLPFDAVAINSGPQTVCAGSSGNVYITDVLPNATTYEWTLPNGSIVATNFPTITISYALSETSGNLSVHGVNSCGNGGESANYDITIIAPPALSSSLTPPPVCSGEPFIYFPTSTPAGATYTWTRALQLNISNPVGAGINEINEILYNSTSSPIAVDYIYTITTPEGCPNTEIVTVIVDPLPTLANPPILPTEVCSGTPFVYTPISNPPGTILWSRNAIPEISEPSVSNSSAPTINETLNNITSLPVTVTYELILPATTAGCTNTVSFDVVVNPVPSDATTIVNGPQTVCAGSTGNIYNANPIPNATSYLWTLPNGSTNTTTTSQITINYTLSNVSGNLTVQGVNSCGVGAVSASYPITVLAPPILTSPTSLPDICSGDTFTYNPTSSSPGITFSWIRILQFGIANAPGFGTDGISETLINTTTNPISVAYIYTMTTPTPELCENTETITVIVNPLPTLTSSTAPAPECSGTAFTIPLTSSEPGSISWIRNTIPEILEGSNFGSGDITETLTNLTDATVSVTYEVTLPNTANGCSDVVFITIDIEAIPSDAGPINSSGPQLVCAGANGNVYTVSAITNATSYAWTLPNGSINTTTTNSITINYGLTDVSGNLSVHGVNSCGIGGESANYPITIIAPPTLLSGLTPPDVCSEELFTYTPTSSSAGATFSWTRAIQSGISNSEGNGNDGISEILVNTTNVPVGVEYVYTINTPEGCENIETVTVFVNPLPQLTSSTVTTEICSGDTFTYTPISTTDPTTINWTRVPAAGILGAASGNGNISDVLINSTGLPIVVTYELDLTPTGQGCTDTVTISVIVNPLPIASISGGGNTCLNSTDNLIIFTGANGTAPFTFTYNIDGLGPYYITTASGNSIAVPSSSSTVGTFLYELTNVQDSNTTSCSNLQTGSAPITVNPLPILIITNPAPVCEIDTVDLTVGAITAGSDTGLAFSYWTNATATTPYLTPATAAEGTYFIMATNTNGCSVIEPVIVTTNPIPTVTVSNVTVCDGDLATVSAIPNPPGAYDYNWSNSVGAPNPGNVASFTTSIAGDYTVEITNQTLPNCVSLTATGTVTLNPLPDATITGSVSTICADDLATISFTGSLGTVPYTFAYNINGGTTQTVLSAGTTATITVNTSVSGNFNFNLLSVTDSSATACTQILTGLSYAIDVLPPPSLTISNPTPICAGDTVDLQTTITPFDSGLTYSYWANIDATIAITSPNAVIEGTYFIKATNSIGCSSIAEVVVTALALPTVTVNSETICEGGTATITATPNISGSYNYNWSVPSGATSPGNVATFTTTVAGNYTVFITDQNAPYCESTTAIGTVAINPLPTATISSSATEVCLNTPLTITFTGATGTAPYTFEYIDENGATQTIFSAIDTATFTVPTNTAGIYNYTLVSVTDSSTTSCSQILSSTASITVRDLPIVDAGPATIEACTGEEITLTATGTATSYVWNNGITNGVPFTPTLSTTYTVIGTDSFGCENTDEVTITIIPTITGTIKTPYDFTVCKDATPPTITFEGANGTAPYIFTYEIASTLLASPITGIVTSTGNEAILVPEIPTTTPGDFVVTIISVEDAGSCTNGGILEPSQAFISVLDAGIVPLNLIEVNQLVCEADLIVDILFDINGSPGDAYVEGLPTGVTSEYVPNVTLGQPGILTISGTPSISGIFNYKVITSSSLIGCNSEFEGTIEVNPLGTLSLSIPESDAQVVCIDAAITTITYDLGGSATGATVIFAPNTPSGVSWTASASTVTISGTSLDEGIYTYTVETFSTTTNCVQGIATGSLTVNNSEITLISGEPNQTICLNNAIEDIAYTITSAPLTSPAASLILEGVLPTGVTFDSNTGEISGSPTEDGVFTYTIKASTGCGNELTGTITVNANLPSVQIEGGLQEIEICIDSEITLTATGADTYEWYNLNTSGIPVTLGTGETYTYTPTANETIYVIGTVVDGCENTAAINILLKQPATATIAGVNTFEVCKDAQEPTITFTGINGIAPYIFTYSIGTIISSVETAATSSSAVISIPTNVVGVYEIKLLSVEDESAYCSPSVLLEPVLATVTVVGSEVLPVAGTLVYQTLCIAESVDPIEFEIIGATGAYADGLPLGISGVYSDITEDFIITGASPESGVFDYTVYTVGLPNDCISLYSGTITINPDDSITLLTEGTDIQSICEGDTIASISYQLEGGATNATVTGLPQGLSWNISASNILTISGLISNLGNYQYTIETLGSCTTTSAIGQIDVSNSEITLVSGDPNPTIHCLNSTTPISIEYAITSIPATVVVAMEHSGSLPDGVTFDTTTGIISGTPTELGIFNYTISAENGCGNSLNGTITVEDTPPAVFAGDDIVICSGESVTLTGSGADTYEWDNLVLNGVPFTPTITATYTVIGTDVNGCINTDEIMVIVNPILTASISGLNVFEVCKDAPEPEITFTGANGTAPYIFTYNIGTITNTVTTTGVNDSVSITVPTNAAGTYIVILENVEDSGNTICSNVVLLEPTEAIITVQESGIVPQSGTPVYQTVCEEESITNIVFDIQGDATGAFVTNLPLGVNYSFTPASGSGNGLVTISGTPTQFGSYDYVITTTGLSATCNATYTGTITVNQGDIITLLTPETTTQLVCECAIISPISYRLEGGATGANVTGLPSGLVWNIAGDILTISGEACGTPNTTYPYQIQTLGTCNQDNANGEITIINSDDVQLASAVGTDNQTICINTPLTTINYSVLSGTSIVISGILPDGVVFNTTNGEITGTPVESGIFNYSISTTNNCSNSITGTIEVEEDQFIKYNSGDVNQVACLNTPIDPIYFNISSTVADVTFTPSLPSGISYTINSGILTILGTPTSSADSANYSITTIGGRCEPAEAAEIVLEITDVATVIIESDSGALNQTVCQSTEIVPITFTLGGAATGIDASSIPEGMTLTGPDALGVYTLVGTTSNTGTTNFQLTTTGSTVCIETVDISITNLNAGALINLTSAAETDSQTLCQTLFTTSIVPIEYSVIGASDIVVTGLPSGVSMNTFDPAIGILTISGVPSQSGIFEYEITLLPCNSIKRGVIKVSTPMSISAVISPISCVGNDAEISVTIIGGANDNGLYAISWSGPNGFQQNQTTITGLAPGDYTISGADAIGCPLPEETFTIEDVEPLAIELTSIVNAGCDGTQGCANFNYAGGTGIYTSFLLEYSNPQSLNWEITTPLNNNYFNICGLEAGLYRLTTTDSADCSTAPYLFTIENQNQFSIENLVIEDTICNSETGILLIEVNSFDTDLIFTFNGELVTSTYLGDNFYEIIINAGATSGNISITNTDGCSISSDRINFETIEPDFEFTSFDFINYGYFSVNTDITFNNLNFAGQEIYDPTRYTQIVWNFGDNTPLKVFNYPDDLEISEDGAGNAQSIKEIMHTYTNDGIYEVTLTIFNNVGCSTSITKTIVIGKGASMMLPNAFSPNGDEINDLFRPALLGIKEVSMYIYDTWGNLVYEVSSEVDSLEPDWGWNGIELVNTEPVNGEYRYYIKAITIDAKIMDKEGRFLLIK